MRDVVDLLTGLGLQGTLHGDEYVHQCPNPDHDDRHPSCSTNVVKGVWCCLACGAKGTLRDLIRLLTGQEVEDPLRDLLRDRLLAEVQGRFQTASQTTTGPLPGPFRPGPLDYLRARGFKRSTLKQWGVRWVREAEFGDPPVQVKFCVGLPARWPDGSMAGWIFRSTDRSPLKQRRYYYTSGFPVGRLWFGGHLHWGCSEILVVEGSLDAMWCSQAGVPAVAVLGSSPSPEKIRMLARFRSVTVLGDRDPAGIKLVRAIGQTLSSTPVRVARYPAASKATDPAELSPDELHRVVDRAIPYRLWAHRPRRLHSGQPGPKVHPDPGRQR